MTVPLFSSDQFDNAARLAEVGAAVTLTTPTALTLRDAVVRALEDDRLRATARSLAAEIAAQPAPAEAIADLRALVAPAGAAR